MPGGMVTTTRRMLAEVGRPELFDSVLEEVTRVREEMGFPIMVTPVSQFVATQATMNVIGGERWRDVSDEMVRYFLGHFYEPAAPVDPQVAERVLSLPRAAELRDLRPLSLEGARERFGARISEEELLLRLTMPARSDPASAPPAGPRRDPLVRLLGELAKRESLSYVRVEKGDDLVVWRRAA
jgi:oxaloacetate decarboxylase alpha subunit